MHMPYRKPFQPDTGEIYRYFQIIAVTAAIANNADAPCRMFDLASHYIRKGCPLGRELDRSGRQTGAMGNSCFFHPVTTFLRDIVKEPRRLLLLDSRIQLPSLYSAQAEYVFGSSHTYIEKPSLLMHFGFFTNGFEIRKNALFEADNEYHRELQTLCAMQGHQ
jgi:hypothetical protein